MKVDSGYATSGFTLLELLLVIAMISILTCVASWGGKHLLRGWQLKRAGHQLLEDLKGVQGRAEMTGSMGMSNGVLVMQRTFLVFAPDVRSYRAYTWRDRNGNGVVEGDESDPLWQKSLPSGVFFGWAPGVDRRACSNVNNPPGNAISYASPGYAPCDNQPCIKFDQHGFSVMGSGTIYLYEGKQSLAISGTRPGHFTLCEWRGERWR